MHIAHRIRISALRIALTSAFVLAVALLAFLGQRMWAGPSGPRTAFAPKQTETKPRSPEEYRIRDPAELRRNLLSSRGSVTPSCGACRGWVSPELESELIEYLSDAAWAANWRHISRMLAASGMTREAFFALRDYATRWDDPSIAPHVQPGHFLFGKIESLIFMGLMPVPGVEPFLLEMLTEEGSRAALSDWPPESMPTSMYHNKELVILSFQGRAAIGLAVMGSPTGAAAVRQLFRETEDGLRRRGIDPNDFVDYEIDRSDGAMLGALRSDLVGGMAAFDARQDFTAEEYLMWRGSHVKPTPLFEYYEKYAN